MIIAIYDWLQDAVDYINLVYPEDTFANLTILYGFDTIGIDEENCGFAAYNPETKTIMLADPNELIGDTFADKKCTAITNLFHEYRHHQQNIYGLDFDEEDAEQFAETMYQRYLRWEI